MVPGSAWGAGEICRVVNYTLSVMAEKGTAEVVWLVNCQVVTLMETLANMRHQYDQ